MRSMKQSLQWPLSLFSLFHFYGASEELDEDLVKEMGYMQSNVEMYPGISGLGRSFSFIIISRGEECIV